MPTLTGVQFTPSDKLQYFDASDLDLAPGDTVIVETWHGEQQATVTITPGQMIHSDLRGPLDRVVRVASNG